VRTIIFLEFVKGTKNFARRLWDLEGAQEIMNFLELGEKYQNLHGACDSENIFHQNKGMKNESRKEGRKERKND
jgi:hypothetical protein